jgi:hypothetical protein
MSGDIPMIHGYEDRHGEPVTHETGDVRQVIERLQRAEMEIEIFAGIQPPHGSLYAMAMGWVQALRESLEQLTFQPAASGWQGRIAAMRPWIVDREDEEVCRFCGRLWTTHERHEPDCLWQNAVDALPPAPESKEARCGVAHELLALRDRLVRPSQPAETPEERKDAK